VYALPKTEYPTLVVSTSNDDMEDEVSNTAAPTPLPSKVPPTMIGNIQPSVLATTFIPRTSTVNTKVSPSKPIDHHQSYAEFLKSTVTRGKLLLHSSAFGGATSTISFTRDPDFFNVLIHLLKSRVLSKKSIDNISQMCKGCDRFITTFFDYHQHPRDITPLFNSTTPRHQLDEAFLQLAFAASFDIPVMLSCLRGEYTADYRDSSTIIETLNRHGCPPTLINDLRRVYTIGAPASFRACSSRSNFEAFLKYGNHSSAQEAKPALVSSIQKEIDRAYAVPLPSWLAPFIPNIHLSPYGLLEIAGKKPRIITDHSYQPSIDLLASPATISVNQMHGITHETPLAYGSTMRRHLIRIYNLRISYPKEILYLFDDDVTAAFRHVKYNLFVAGAFSAIANSLLLIHCAQTFGSVTSPSNYESLALTRAFLSETFSNPMYEHLQTIHQLYLDMVRWAGDHNTSVSGIVTTCIMDALNPGVIVEGQPVNTPHYPFVDDTLYADLKKRILQAIAASIEACFIIFGARNDNLRPCPLSLEKFQLLSCSPIRQQLGLIINTNTLCICIPSSKLEKLQQLMRPLHTQRRQITVSEGAKLLGNLDHLASHIPWFRHLYLSIRSTFNVAVARFHRAIERSDTYIHLLGQSDHLSGSQLAVHQRFIAKWLSSQLYSDSNSTFFLSTPFRNDLAIIRTLVSDQSLWVTPIPHIIPRTPSFTAYCDSCMTGAGGYSPELKFLWYIQWQPHDAPIDGLLGDETHINILEYLAILITYAIAQRCLLSNPAQAPDTYPVINISSDNTTAVSWAQKTISSNNPIAKHAARIACLLQLNARLGLKVAYIEGDKNIVSDALSRLYSNSSSPLLPSAIQTLQERFQSLASCTHCPVPPNLLSLITRLFSRDAAKLVLEWPASKKQRKQDNNSIETGWNLIM
jgi:hypothetical protein